MSLHSTDAISLRGDMRRRFSITHRWPLVLANGPKDTTRRVRITLAAVGLVLLGGAVFGSSLPLPLRFVLGAIALGVLAVPARRRNTMRASGTSVVADTMGISRISPEGTKPIVGWNAPFGVTLLASYGRPCGLLAFTTATQTRYVPAWLDGRSEDDDELFARIAVLADLDLVDGVTHDPALKSSDAAAVVRLAEAHERMALGRAFLSDGRGVPISLDRGTLSVMRRTFDLTSQFEWRTLMFHESTGQAAALYQGTWIRQNGTEVVLVAPMPASIVPKEPNAHREARGRLGRALTRQLRLLQSPTESPPAREVRVAIDRPFMMAVRRVLDEAPLASRVAAVVPKRRSAGRDSMA